MNCFSREMGKWIGCVLVMGMGIIACHQGSHHGGSPEGSEKAPEQPPAEEPAANEQGSGFEMTDPPAEGDVYHVLADETDISFVIVSNSAGPVTGRFPEGVTGWLNFSDGSGKISVQIDTLKTAATDGLDNPLRDANIVESFFGVRPSAILPEPVDAAWAKLEGMLMRNVANAGFEVTGIEGVDAAQTESAGSVSGRFVLWNRISMDLSFAVNANGEEGRLVLSSSEPVTIDLVQVLGEDLRNLVFDTMLAAGCAHQPGIQNQVAITLNKIVLQKAG